MSLALRLFAAPFALVLGAANLQAAPADLDPSFGAGGITLTDVTSGSDGARDALLLPDGRIIVCGSANNLGSFLIGRYSSNGALDPSFGTGGFATTPFGGSGNDGTCLARQSDGKLVVAGSFLSGANHFSAIARYDSNGVLDPAFGTNGKVTQVIGPIGDVQDVAIQGDGRIVIVGSFRVSGSTTFVGLRRYLSDGTIDASFGASGTVTRGPGTDNHGYALTLQPDGKILVAGTTDLGGGLGEEFLTFRFKTNGTPDSTFATFGRAITDISPFRDFAKAIAVLPDGRVLTAGHIGVAANLTHKYAVVRFLANGTLDAGFGAGGIALTPEPGLTTGYAFLDDLFVYPSGEILLAGQATNPGTSDDFAMARMDSTGAMDSGFGNGGIAALDLAGGGRDTGYKVLVQGDGRIVEVGSAGTGVLAGGSQVGLARFRGDAGTVGVGPRAPLTSARLDAPWPNPCHASATLRFALAEPGEFSLAVFDLAGREVARLVSGHAGAGEQAVQWSPAARDGGALGSGVYFARLEVRTDSGRRTVAVRRLLLAR